MGCGFAEEGLPVKEKRNNSEISACSGRDGREYFIYRDDVSDNHFTRKTGFPFSESLFSLLDLDIWKREPQIRKIDRALLNLYRTRDARYTEDVFFTLQSLSDVHRFFKLLFPDWSGRLNEAEKDGYAAPQGHCTHPRQY